MLLSGAIEERSKRHHKQAQAFLEDRMNQFKLTKLRHNKNWFSRTYILGHRSASKYLLTGWLDRTHVIEFWNDLRSLPKFAHSNYSTYIMRRSYFTILYRKTLTPGNLDQLPWWRQKRAPGEGALTIILHLDSGCNMDRLVFDMLDQISIVKTLMKSLLSLKF